METVELVKKNESYVIKIENDFLINQVEYTFTGTEKGTLVRSRSNLEGKGVLMKSIFPFMRGMFRSDLHTSLNRLKKTVEDDE